MSGSRGQMRRPLVECSEREDEEHLMFNVLKHVQVLVAASRSQRLSVECSERIEGEQFNDPCSEACSGKSGAVVVEGMKEKKNI